MCVREQLSRVSSLYRLGSRDQIWVAWCAIQDPVCVHICNTMLLWLITVTKAQGRIMSWCLTFTWLSYKEFRLTCHLSGKCHSEKRRDISFRPRDIALVQRPDTRTPWRHFPSPPTKDSSQLGSDTESVHKSFHPGRKNSPGKAAWNCFISSVSVAPPSSFPQLVFPRAILLNTFCFTEKGFGCLTGVSPWTKEKPVSPSCLARFPYPL